MKKLTNANLQLKGKSISWRNRIMGARQDILKIVNFSYFWIVLFLVWPSLVGASEVPVPEMDPQGFPAIGTGCLANGKCHVGIEPIRAHNSGMAKEIYRKRQNIRGSQWLCRLPRRQSQGRKRPGPRTPRCSRRGKT